MDNSSKPSNPSSMRVLIRPPQPPLTPSSNPVDPSRTRPSHSFARPSVSSPSPPPPPPNPSQLTGVVVVGFIGRREGDVSQLINRVVDSDAFGSGNRRRSLPIEGGELRDWFESRAIAYHHDEEKGILYLQMCSTKCPAVSSQWMAGNSNFDSPVEEHEFGDLQGMLFMFTVCHVIVYILEGSQFDVEVLRRLRVLQSAKHALSPFIKSRNSTSSSSKPPLSSSHASPMVILSKNAPPGRGGGIFGRSPSAISVMSGLGLYTSLFPGQCTPVTLFVFVDDFSDMTSSSTSVEDTIEASALNSLGRSPLHTQGSGSVAVLARSMNKSEGGSRKKLQSSLEGQIRFLIKKCRPLFGSEHSHGGSRGGPASGSAPLLTLDASRAVLLLDRSSNQRGMSLDYACGLVEDVLNGKATPESLLLEKHSQSGNKEDIMAVKEFIFRQADILRGRGGLATNANSGSAAGVGMVAVAAAAAAASASSGKSTATPELPSLDVWVSSSQIILRGIFSAKHVSIEEQDFRRRKFRQRNGVPPQVEGAEPLDIAVSLLESGKGMNTKFSSLWCQRVLPAAMDVYMKDLPALYPTSQHEAHLEKALRFFHSMVKGPSLIQFMKKLEDDCTSIWKSGRQLCDAVSLTGKPCMHQKHDNEEKQHCSGYVFLHACACGRSRRIRADPYDFETANEFNSFEDCDNLLPAHKLPKVSDNESIQKGSWIIVKVGGLRYYDPYRGLLQSGFCSNQKFLMKWTIVLDKDRQPNDAFLQCFWQGALSSAAADSNSTAFPAETNSVTKSGLEVQPGERQTQNETQKLVVDKLKQDDKRISFGNGLPNLTMKKPFSEVVAGVSANSAFPPLQSKKQSSVIAERGSKNSSRDMTAEKANIDLQKHSKTEECISTMENINQSNPVRSVDTNPSVQIGNNVIQLNVNDGSKSNFSPSLKHIIVYVGFEHECPHGHRFILSTEHLNELGLPYSSSEDSSIPSSMDNLDNRHQEPSSVGQSGGYSKGHRALHRNVNVDKSREFGAYQNDPHLVDPLNSLKSGKKQGQMSIGVSKIPDSARHFQSVKLDDGGQAFSLLNRNLPVYINCPHCRVHKNKKDRRSAKFAGTISQLQRIFVVTPPFPVVLSANPVVQFEGSCQTLDASKYEQQLQFSLGCQVVLPPESFVSIRLPFIYNVQLEHKGFHPLNPFEPQPELTAWLKKGTTLSVISKGTAPDQLFMNTNDRVSSSLREDLLDSGIHLARRGFLPEPHEISVDYIKVR
ncbi:hypothetical protein V2J09_011495 [Rumex salicifolius]